MADSNGLIFIPGVGYLPTNVLTKKPATTTTGTTTGGLTWDKALNAIGTLSTNVFGFLTAKETAKNTGFIDPRLVIGSQTAPTSASALSSPIVLLALGVGAYYLLKK